MTTQPPSAQELAALREEVRALATQLGVFPPAQAKEHGHAMLIRRAKSALHRLAPAGESPLLIEIGSTREDLPGQGSTAKLAQFATEVGAHFVTVDMDPENTEHAQRTLSGTRFEAVNSKGEDYLRSDDSPIDFIYLDAFDYWHPHHSEKRKEKYAQYLGTEISDGGAAQMHLECAEAIVTRIHLGGIVVIDDTFFNAGVWTGKGATAVPYLLKHGYWIDDIEETVTSLVRVR